MSWKLTPIGKTPKLNEPVLIEGLPGIGNVGKIAADFIVDKLKAKKIYELFSYKFPHAVFVNEDNLVDLPRIEIFHKKIGANDLLLLVGDIQPVDEVSSYEFADTILDLCEELKVREIVTLGGIGLNDVSEQPVVYCTANSKEIVKKYTKGTGVNDKIYGVVGPIIGATGLLVGLAGKRKIPAIALLTETLAIQAYMGVKSARETLKVLNKVLGLKLTLKVIDEEIKNLEEEVLKRVSELGEIAKSSSEQKQSTTYIG